MAKANLQTYHILYSDMKEECVKATRVHSTAKLVSFYNNKSLVLAVPVSEIRRIGQNSFGTVKDFELQVEESEGAKRVRAHLANLKVPRNEQAAN